MLKKFSVGGWWWWKVIIVSALSLSLRDKERFRDWEIERAWQYNNTTTIPLSLIHVDVDYFLILFLMKVFEYWKLFPEVYIFEPLVTLGFSRIKWVTEFWFEIWVGLVKWRGEKLSRKWIEQMQPNLQDFNQIAKSFDLCVHL